MSQKKLLILALATLLAVLAAAAVPLFKPSLSNVQRAGELAFPQVAAGTVAEATITNAKGSFRLAADSEGRWIAPDKGSYPLATDALRQLLLTLSQMKIVEAKTSDPARLARLWLEETGPEAPSARLTLKDPAGAVLLDIFVGKRLQQLVLADASGDAGGSYFRHADENQAWLASGRLTLGETLLDYLPPKLLSIANETIARVVITHPDGAVLLAERAGPAGVMELKTGLQPGEIANLDAVGRMANGLDPLTIEDLALEGAIALAPENTVRTSITTFEGLVLALDLTKLGEATWLRVSVRASESAPTDGEARQALDAQIADITAATQGWVFEIPARLYGYMAITPAELALPQPQ